MKSKKVSIVIPVYNNEKYVGRAIESILDQSYKNIELIIVDDGSTDNSLAVCNMYKKKMSHIEIIHKKNSGVSSARNSGINVATGDYLVFIDSDDWVDKDYIESLVNNMKDGGLAVCRFADEMLKNKASFSVQLDRDESLISLIDYNGILGYPFCKMYDLKIIKKNDIKFDLDVAICEDVLFVAQYICNMNDITNYFGYYGYHYFNNENGAMSNIYKVNDGNDIKKKTSEIVAINKMECYYQGSEKLKNYYKLRKVKAMVNVLRVGISNNYKSTYKRQYINYIRKNILGFMQCKLFPFSAKMSVLLSCINPYIEYWVWRMKK